MPCLPSSLADYADAPTPYLMGFRSVRGTSAGSSRQGYTHDGGSSVINGSNNNNVLDDALAAERLDGEFILIFVWAIRITWFFVYHRRGCGGPGRQRRDGSRE